MKKMKKGAKQIKKFFHRYINGTKGVISLFLALVMLPFLSVALIIVESARYQSTVELVDEMLDCAGLSTIANFDSYLEKRFGLLALSQEITPEEHYNKYLAANTLALSNSFTYISSEVKGMYPLSDVRVLKSQLAEYSEVTATVEALNDLLDIDELLKQLSKMLNFDNIGTIITASTKIADAATSVVELLEALTSLIEKSEAYQTQVEQYEEAVSNFQEKVGDLIKELNNAQAELALNPTETENTIYDNNAVQDAISEGKTASNKFSAETQKMADAAEAKKKAITDILEQLNKAEDKVNDAIKAVDKIEMPEDMNAMVSWIETAVKKIKNVLDKFEFLKKVQVPAEKLKEVMDIVTDVGEATVTVTSDEWRLSQQVKELKSQKEKIATVKWDSAESDDTTKYYINVDTDVGMVALDFPVVVLDTEKEGFASAVTETEKEVSESITGSDEKGGLSTLLTLLDVAAELLDVQVLWDGALDSCVSQDYNSDVPWSSTAIMLSLTTIIQSGRNFVDRLFDGFDIIGMLKALAEFMLGFAEFLAGIILWVSETLVNISRIITTVVSDVSEIGDAFLLSAYSIYNMPCRTTYSDGKTLNGYKYEKIFELMEGEEGKKVSGMMKDIKTIMGESAGDDLGFKGAEVEYLLIGSNNELLNQSVAFFNLYMFRLSLDILRILTNVEVAEIAVECGMASWVYYLAVIIVQPLLETIILVHGKSVNLFAHKLYLTKSGVRSLVSDLIGLDDLKDKIKKVFSKDDKDDKDEEKEQGILEMNYQEYMLLLLLLTTNQTQLLSRMANLIQMEAAAYYKEKFDFNLDNANTYIKVNVSGTLNSMFDMEALTDDGPFTINRVRRIGY